MSKWFLRFANSLISFVVTVCLVAAVCYAGFALWDNQQIYDAADHGLGSLALADSIIPEEPAERERPKAAEAAESQGPSDAAEAAEPQEQPEAHESKGAEAQASEDEGAGSGGSELEQLFARLKGVNPDIGAWIKMPNTAIDYPVVHSENNIDYVSTDIYGNFAITGSVFLDFRNLPDYSDPYNLIYAHNMDQHRMFGDVNLYKDEQFFNENQKGTIYFPTGAHWLQVISVIVTPSSNSWMMNPLSWVEMEDETILEKVREDALFVSEEGMRILREQLASDDDDVPLETSEPTDETEPTEAPAPTNGAEVTETLASIDGAEATKTPAPTDGTEAEGDGEAEEGDAPVKVPPIHIIALSTCSNEFTDARTILLTLMDP